MILIPIFLLFWCAFFFLHREQVNVCEQNYTADLVTSFASYVRIFGRLPSSADNNSIPWNKIGIASSFFNVQDAYQPNVSYLNEENLLPIDSLRWVLNSIVFEPFINDFQERDFAPEYQSKKHILHLDPEAFSLQVTTFGQKHVISVTNELLLYYMNFDKMFLQYANNSMELRAVYPSHKSLLKHRVC